MSEAYPAHDQVPIAAHGPDPRRPQAHAVTASFHRTDTVQQALERLIRIGVPRDMIDVVVSPAAAREFYPGQARDRGTDALRFAGVGGLVGLGVGSLVSLILLMMPGFFDKGVIPYVQLIGPNFVTVAGATIGAAIGLFRKRHPDPSHARAAEEPDAIIMVVNLRSRNEAESVSRILMEEGGSEPRIQR